MENQEKDVFSVILYLELDETEEYTATEGMITYESGGKYKVHFVVKKSGYRTIAAVIMKNPEIQKIKPLMIVLIELEHSSCNLMERKPYLYRGMQLQI